jgi:hypothetical protein
MRPGVSEATPAGCGRLRDARDGPFAGGSGAGMGRLRRRPGRPGGDGAFCEGDGASVTEMRRFAREIARPSRRRRVRREDARLRGGSRPSRSRCVDLGPHRGVKGWSRDCDRGEIVNFATSPSHLPRRSRPLRHGRLPRRASRHEPRPSPAPPGRSPRTSAISAAATPRRGRRRDGRVPYLSRRSTQGPERRGINHRARSRPAAPCRSPIRAMKGIPSHVIGIPYFVTRLCATVPSFHCLVS